MRVRQGEQQTSFTDSKGISHQLPFSITLNQFEIIYYKGTLAPMDFISHISVADKDCHRQIQGKVSMNHIFHTSTIAFINQATVKIMKEAYLVYLMILMV